MPADLKLSSAEAAPGDGLTVSSGAASCDLDLANGTAYRLTLISGDENWILGEVKPASDGQFSAEVTVPADAPSRRARIDVSGSPYDECNDTQSCVGYSVNLQVEQSTK